jgi:general secretion pathway protein D
MSPTPVTATEAYRVFEAILQVKGFTTVQGPGGITKIVPVREAKESPIETLPGTRRVPDRDLYITRLIPLRFVKADAIATTLRQLVSKDASMVAYAPTNTLILTDSASNVRRLLTIIGQIDVETYQEQIKVIPIQFADAQTLAGHLEEIFRQEGGRREPSRPTPRRRGSTATPPAVESVVGELGEPRFITDERTNSIIVLAPQATIRQVEQVIRLLDYKRKGSGRVHVYRLQNADAEEMAQTLSSLASGGTAPAVRPGTQAQAAAQAAVAELEGGVRVTALIIQASSEGFAALRDVIESLDIRRPQVLVETLIMEVLLDDATRLGSAWLYTGSLGGNNTRRIRIGSSTGFAENITNPFGPIEGEAVNPGDFVTGILGETVDLIGADGAVTTVPTIQGIIIARGSDSNTNIIATPQVLTADNEEAQIVIGQNIPIITGRVQSATGVESALSTSQNIERQDVGVTLRVTPQISEGDTVRLDIFQEISRVIPTDEASELGPTTTKRTLENTVYVKDGQAVMIGGIIEDQQTENVTKVPFLGDIPILGWAFKSTTDTILKNNLVVVLTPHVVRDPEDLKRLTLERREQFRSTAAEGLEFTEEEREAREKALQAGLELPLDPNPVRRQLEKLERHNPVEALPQLREEHEQREQERLEELAREKQGEAGSYAVQVAQFHTAAGAVELLERLLEEGYDGTVLTRRERDEVIHFVELGPYVTEEQALHVAREVRATSGFATRVVIEP